jgi:predicted dehydrogenase
MTTAALSGVALSLNARADDPVKTPAATDKPHVAFIGVGGKGEHNLATIGETGVNVVALCDIDSVRLLKASAKHPTARKYADWRKLLEQNDIDAVVVTTPDHTHFPAAMSALKLGKHVYCEKPLCHDVTEVRKLTEMARAKKVATQMGNAGHASETIRRQVEWVQSGVIGNVTEVHCWTDRPNNFWPQGMERPKETPPVPESIAWDLWLGTAPARPYHPAYHPFKWRGFWDFGTGALGDMACHVLDYPFWALGLTHPTSVETVEALGATAESAPKSSVLRYQFPARGDSPPLSLTWYDGGKLPACPKGIEKIPPKDGGTMYVGTKGTLVVPFAAAPQLAGEPNFKGPSPTLPRAKSHYQEWTHAIRGGAPGGTNFDYAGPLTETVLLGNVALRTGKKLEWDAANLKITNAPEAETYLRREYRKGWDV